MRFLLRVSARRRSRARLRFVGRWGTAGLDPPIEQVQELVSARLAFGTSAAGGRAGGLGRRLFRRARAMPLTPTAALAGGRLRGIGTGVGLGRLGPGLGRSSWLFDGGLGHYRWGWSDFRRGRTRRAWRGGDRRTAWPQLTRGGCRQLSPSRLCLFSRQSALTPLVLINQPPQRGRYDEAGDNRHPDEPATTARRRMNRLRSRRKPQRVHGPARKAGLAAALGTDADLRHRDVTRNMASHMASRVAADMTRARRMAIRHHLRRTSPAPRGGHCRMGG